MSKHVRWCGRLVSPALVLLAGWSLSEPSSVLADAASPSDQAEVQAPEAPGEESDPTGRARDLPAEYTAAIDIGVQEFGLGNFEEARARFLEAHHVFPNARTLRALGMVAYELRHYVSSILYLEQALASRERPLTERLRRECERLRAQAEGYVARYRVSLEPPEADIWVDGSQVELAADGTLVLPVGDHVIESRAAGHLPQRRRVRVLGGDREALDLSLTPAARKKPGPQPERRHGRARRAWLWASVAAVVVASATTGLVLALREPGSKQPSGGTTGQTVSLGDQAAFRF